MTGPLGHLGRYPAKRELRLNDFANRPQFSRSPVFAWSGVAFFAFLLLAYFTGLNWLYIPAILSWVLGYALDVNARKRLKNQTAQFKRKNVRENPAVFAQRPPQNLESIDGEYVDLYDLETGLPIGTVMKRDIQTLFDAFDNDPLVFENGPNDIPITQDFIEQINESDKFQLTPHFLDLMHNAMDEKFLTLITIRWVQRGIAG